MSSLVQIAGRIRALAARLSWFPPALTRLTLGVIFIGTGWGKLHSLEKVTEFFTQLHIPAPSFNAALVATTELTCGALLLVGLLARIAAIPLIATMCVALATARSGDIEGIRDLFGLQEFDYLVLLIWIALCGAGTLSADHALLKATQPRRVNRQVV